MEIINASANLTTVQIYRLTRSPKTHKLSECVGQRLEVDAWCVYQDADKKTGEAKKILTMATPEGEVFGTNSPTFIESFLDMWELFEQAGETVHAVNVISGTSKAGRTFVMCEYAE